MNKEFKLTDLRRIARYNLILKVCKQQKRIAEISEAIPAYSGEMLRHDCRHLADAGYLRESRFAAGKFNQIIAHYTTLVSKFDESKLIPIHVLINKAKNQAKGQRSEEKPKEVLPPNVRIIYGYDRHIHIPVSKTGRNYVSGSTLSAMV